MALDLIVAPLAPNLAPCLAAAGGSVRVLAAVVLWTASKFEDNIDIALQGFDLAWCSGREAQSLYALEWTVLRAVDLRLGGRTRFDRDLLPTYGPDVPRRALFIAACAPEATPAAIRAVVRRGARARGHSGVVDAVHGAVRRFREGPWAACWDSETVWRSHAEELEWWRSTTLTE